MEVVQGNSIDTVWLKWVEKANIFSTRKSEVSRDGNVCFEELNAITIINDPRNNIMLNEIRKLSLKYMVGEMLWYNSKSKDLKGIQLYTKNWDRMSDDGKTVNSNYGYCIHEKFDFDQYEMVKDVLRKDKNSRQAVIHIKEPRDIIENPTKDLNCTVCLQFFIREDKLYCTTYMRSNDLWLGFPYDVFNFTCIQIRMAMELGVGLGTYTHIAGSLHLYERDYNKIIKGGE